MLVRNRLTGKFENASFKDGCWGFYETDLPEGLPDSSIEEPGSGSDSASS